MAKKTSARKAAKKQVSKKKVSRRPAAGSTDPKRPADPPVKPVKTRIGPGTTRTPRTLPATGE